MNILLVVAWLSAGAMGIGISVGRSGRDDIGLATFSGCCLLGPLCLSAELGTILGQHAKFEEAE